MSRRLGLFIATVGYVGYAPFAPGTFGSAAGLVALYSAGIYEGNEIDRTLKYLMQFKPNLPISRREIPDMHWYYGQYYAAQALWTAAHLKLPVTYVILNNRSYRILKERMVSFRGARSFTGMELREPAIGFKAIAEAMGVTAAAVSDPREIDSALREAIGSGAPRLLEFIVDSGFA